MIGVKPQSGFTLLEIIVSIAIFTVLIILTTSIFQSINEGQRSTLAGQNTQESMRFALEVMSKEMRTSMKADTACGGATNNKVFNTNNDQDQLFFLNKNNECTIYYLDDVNHRLMINRDDGIGAPDIYPVTPDEVVVSDLKFYIKDDAVPDFHSVQPRVTMKLKVQMDTISELHKNEIDLQTTVSSRHYE